MKSIRIISILVITLSIVFTIAIVKIVKKIDKELTYCAKAVEMNKYKNNYNCLMANDK